MKKNRVFVKYYSYHIRLVREGRKKNSFFKIVVVNSNNRIVANLGYLMPHAYKKSKIKPIGINRMCSIFWILKHAMPSYFIFFLFENVGLIKNNKMVLNKIKLKMKKLKFFNDLLKISKNFQNKKIQVPKVGDNVWIKFLYVQGLKVYRFYSKTFFGRCIAYKKKNVNTSLIIIRNVYNRYPLELSFFLNSPFVIQTLFKKKDRHLKYKKSKLFYLRTKKIAQSKVKR